MEERLKYLKQAISDAEKGKNTNTEKFESLWDIQPLISKTPKETVQKLLPEFYSVLNEVLLPQQGATSMSKPLLRVAVSVLCQLFDFENLVTKGPLTWIRNLQTVLSGNKKVSPTAINSAVFCLGVITAKKGMQVASSLNDTVMAITKQLRSNDVQLKVTVLEALRDIVEGVGQSGVFVHGEIGKSIKPCFTDKSPEVRIAACNVGGDLGVYFTNFPALDASLQLCVKNLEDDNSMVRTAAALAIGKQTAVACTTIAISTEKVQPVKGVAPAPKRPTTVWSIEAVGNFFGNLFVKGKDRTLRAAVSQAYVAFLHELRAKDVEGSMELIINGVISLLGFINPKTLLEDSQHSRICVSYILRFGLGENLGESAQQIMVKILAIHLQKKNVLENEFMVIALLNELSNLFLALGEGANPVREALANVLLPGLLGHSSVPVRFYACLCFRCLATALPGHLAHMIMEGNARVKAVFGKDKLTEKQLQQSQQIALQGNALALSALISVVPATQLGVPNAATNTALQLAQSLFYDIGTTNVVVAEAGWSIIGSLMKLGSTFAVPRLGELFGLWKQALNCDAGLPKAPTELSIFLQTKTHALIALTSFIKNCSDIVNSKVARRVVTLLNNLLAVSSAITARGNIVSYYKLNLLRAYAALGQPQFYSQTHVSLIKVIVSEILDGPATSVKSYLHSEDSILGPWSEEIATVEELLLSELPPRVERDLAVVWSGTPDDAIAPANHIAVSLVDTSIKLFPQLFLYQQDKNKSQIMEHFSTCLKQATPQRKPVVMNNVLILLLQISRDFMNKKASLGGVSTQILEIVKNFVSDNTVEYRRLASEVLGMLARIEGDNLTLDLAKSLISMLRKSKEPTTRSGCAFALGCIERYVGGMRTTGILPSIVTVLGELLKDPSSLVRTWALHSLCLTIEAAGPALSPLAAPALTVLYSLLLNEESTTTDEFRCVGRVVHDIVSALGPELKATSPIMKKCAAVAIELRNHVHPLVQLEAINFNQGLILFAPQTLDFATMIPFLRSQITSEYLLVRRAAVTCLRQLAQLSAVEVSRDKLEEQLFMMLDNERDRLLRKEIQMLLSSLIDSLSPTAPSYWIKLCSRVVLASVSSKMSSSAPQIKTRVEEAEPSDVEENEVGILKSVTVETSKDDDSFVARWRTKVYSMECIRRIMSGVSNNPLHFDLVAARARPNQDFLIQSLSELIKVAFTTATSDTESLRPIGVYVMKDIVEKFSKAIDPDFAGHSLLEQYQAQITSTLRPAFAPEAPPPVTAAACSIVVPFATGNVVRDGKAIARLLKLLTDRIDGLLEINFPAYSERATTMVQLAILTALAQLYASARDDAQATFVIEQLEPYLDKLKPLWIALLRDYSVLESQNAPTQKVYQATFFTYSTITSVVEYYQSAWSVVLLASAYLVNTPHWDKETKLPSSERKPEEDYYLLFGIAMISLAGTISSANAVVLLRAVRQLLQNLDKFTLELARELLDVIGLLMETADVDVQLEAIKVVQYLISTLTPAWFDSNNGEPLLCNFLEIALSTVHRHIPNIFPSDKGPITIKPTSIPVVEVALSALSSFSGLFTDSLRSLYAPTLLFIFLRVLEMSCSISQLSSLVATVTHAVKNIAKLPENSKVEKWDKVLEAAVFTIIEIYKNNEFLVVQSTSTPLMLCLFSVLLELPASDDESTHVQVVKLVQQALESPELKVQQVALQCLRAYVTTGVSKPQLQSFKYISILGADIILVLQRMVKIRELSPEQVAVCSECVRILVFVQASSPVEKQPAILAIVVPTLTNLLGVSALHDLALQILMKLAASGPMEFKQQVAALADSERQLLESSLRAHYAQQTQQQTQKVESTVKTAVPLKLDFSKYNQ